MTRENTPPQSAAKNLAAKFLARSRAVAAASLVILCILCAGCGSSSSSNNLSPAQAQAVSQQFSTALQGALTASLPASAAVQREPHSRLGSILKNIHPDESSGCTSSDSGESCNIPVSYSGSCPGGGTIAITGGFMFSLDDSGDGSGSTSITITPTNCSVSSETINGNPSVTASTAINFTDDAPVFPIVLNEKGGISFSPNPSGSCTVNVQYTVSSETSCTVSGTLCGQSVSGSC